MFPLSVTKDQSSSLKSKWLLILHLSLFPIRSWTCETCEEKNNEKQSLFQGVDRSWIWNVTRTKTSFMLMSCDWADKLKINNINKTFASSLNSDSSSHRLCCTCTMMFLQPSNRKETKLLKKCSGLNLQQKSEPNPESWLTWITDVLSELRRTDLNTDGSGFYSLEHPEDSDHVIT